MTLTKINHTFTYPSLSYDAKPNIQPCIKLSFFFSKLPEVSYEQFHGHWNTVHADLTVAAKVFSAFKIQRYVQIGQTPEMKAKAAELAAAGTQMLDFDGCSEIWVKTWDDWVRFNGSEEYRRIMAPDCKYFMKMPISVYVGQENIVFGRLLRREGVMGFWRVSSRDEMKRASVKAVTERHRNYV